MSQYYTTFLEFFIPFASYSLFFVNQFVIFFANFSSFGLNSASTDKIEIRFVKTSSYL